MKWFVYDFLLGPLIWRRKWIYACLLSLRNFFFYRLTFHLDINEFVISHSLSIEIIFRRPLSWWLFTWNLFIIIYLFIVVVGPNNELYYEVGFNKGVGSLKMWLHLYFDLSLLWYFDLLKSMLVIGGLGQLPTVAWCLTLRNQKVKQGSHQDSNCTLELII